MPRLFTCSTFAALALFTMAPLAPAQAQGYPSKALRMVVAFAPGWIVEDLRKVRARCTRPGTPLLDAHVTVKGGFSNPRDLGALRKAIAECVEGYPPFTVRTMDPQVLIAWGLKALGENAAKIGNLTLTPDLISELMRATRRGG